MKAWKIERLSSCGSYFNPYLQHLIVIAETAEEAIERVQAWQDENGVYFVHDDPAGWSVDCLGPVAPGVIASHEASDY